MFENIISRKNTNCAKWDETIEKYKNSEIIPLTVADMDFRASPEIINALIKASNHGIYGYTNVSKKYISLTKKWCEKHYNFNPEEEWIVYCPRVIQTISLFIQNYTAIQDKILIQVPLYDPIQTAIKINDRNLITNELIFENNNYHIDFDDFEKKLSQGVKIFIAVSPHNPVGRVWKEKEIEKIVKLCKKYEVLIISDEVHADFVWDEEFISYGKFLDTYDKIVVCNSASKTFNIAGLEASSTIIKNKKLREFFETLLRKSGIHNPNYFCIPAVETAYEYGDEWLIIAKKYIKENKDYARYVFDNELKGFKTTTSEGTYMLWVSYKDTGLNEKELEDLMINKAKVLFSSGSNFGKEGIGFIRVNVGSPRALLEKALSRFKINFDKYMGDKK